MPRHSLDQIELRTVRGQKHQVHVRRDDQPTDRVEPTVVEDHHVLAVQKRLRKAIQVDLEALGG